MCSFRDNYSAFTQAGAAVLGVSSDSLGSHAAFADKYDLPFSLLSDADDEVRSAYGVKSDFFGALKGRQTFVIDKAGVVQLSFNSQLEPEKHIIKALEVLGA